MDRPNESRDLNEMTAQKMTAQKMTTQEKTQASDAAPASVSGETIVEFFSEEALENIMALLTCRPARIFYLGHKHNMITKKMKSLRRFAEITAPETMLEFIEVPRDNLQLCIQAIEDICDRYPEARFELTGGGEMFLIAFGYVSARRPVNILRIDPYTGTEIDFTRGEETTEPLTKHTDVRISVAENIVLHGGTLRPCLTNWDFDELFREEVQEIWGVAKRLGHNWNKYCSIIEEVVKNYPEDQEHVFRLPRAALKDSVALLQALKDRGMMDFYRVEKHMIIFRFANRQIREVVTKTGNILELHVYEVATREPTEFTDAVTGAIIDWEGQTKDPDEDYPGRPRSETINEIDVILMRNAVPTFISCKSGRADSKALHELETVTSRFGGRYAKKVLVMATPCEVAASGGAFFKQRAKDMHIWVIDDVYSMTDTQLIRKLRKIQGE